MDRDRLAVHRAYRVWDSSRATTVALCPWCDKELDDSWECHEYLVKRSVVPKERQELIMVLENMVPLHAACHREYGSSREMTRRVIWRAAKVLGADRIGRWYTELWKSHGLAVPKGLYQDPETISLARAPKYIEIGFKALGKPNDTSDEEAYAAFASAFRGNDQSRREWAKKLPKDKLYLMLVASTGFWMNYLLSVVDALPEGDDE